MTIINHTVTKTVTVTIDTDTFTKEQWKEFILANVPPQWIRKKINEDMFAMEWLKEKAIQCYNLHNEFTSEL